MTSHGWVSWTKAITIVAAIVVSASVMALDVSAITPLPTPPPNPGGFGVEATKKQAPPTEGARITSPSDGANVSNPETTVQGICPKGLLVQLYNNQVMVGSSMCENGSFSIKILLFAGKNDLRAGVLDQLDQPGPMSNIVSVQYRDINLNAFGELVTITSGYARRSAQAGSTLSWPLQLSGGTGPYAISIDWGDGSDLELASQSLAGGFDIRHIYKKAGIYQININVTDKNGVKAFIQLVAVSSGQVEEAAPEVEAAAVVARPQILWIPLVVLLTLLLPTYWLGRRSQLVSLRNKMEKERDSYKQR